MPTSFFHFHDKDGVEVDTVLERGRAVAGIEVKGFRHGDGVGFPRPGSGVVCRAANPRPLGDGWSAVMVDSP